MGGSGVNFPSGEPTTDKAAGYVGHQHLIACCPIIYSRFFGALYVVERTMSLHNDKYQDKWRELSIGHHLYRAGRHLVLYAIGNKSEPHIAHAATRLMMAAQLSFEKWDRGVRI